MSISSLTSDYGTHPKVMGSQSSEKFKPMKLFNISVKEYIKTRTDNLSTVLNKHLAHIMSDMDLSIFDPHNSVAAEFYVNLYELMIGFDSSSGGLIWCAISVLERACRNCAARHALIHTFKFIPILTKLLSGVLGTDKRVRVLTLMQDLTYGIKITWQEPHLAMLMSQLTDWVRTGAEPLASLSLSVMVNLCYKNLPATYILTRSVDTKEFITSVVRLQENNSAMQVHLCKMIIILQNMSGEISKADLLKFVKVTFSTIEEAYKARDMALLRHIVDFFIDMRGQTNTQNVLPKYTSFANDINNLLATIETNNCPAEQENSPQDCTTDPLCMAMIFEFLHSLIQLDLPDIQPLHPRLVTMALKWVQQEPASSQALGILRTIAHQCTELDSASPFILDQLSHGFSFLVLSLEGHGFLKDSPEHITSLIQLLLAMAKRPTLKDKVLCSVKDSWVNLVFSPLIDTDTEDRPTLDTTQLQYTKMFVHCLSLVSELAQMAPKLWAVPLIKLIRKTPVQVVVARAMLEGDSLLREHVFNLAKVRECDFPSNDIAKAICDIEHIVMASSGKSNCQGQMYGDVNIGMPLMSIGQEGRLDGIICKLEEAASKNQISNPVTSEVMELYEYKLAAMSHTERTAQSSLESANSQITSLNHRLALLSTEVARLHGMLYSTQLSHERLVDEKRSSSMRLAEVEVVLKESHNKLQVERERRIRTTTDLKGRLDNTETKLAAKLTELDVLNKQFNEISEENKKMVTQNRELANMLEKYEERYKTCKVKVEERESALVQARKQIVEMKREIESVSSLAKRQEEKIMEYEAANLKLKDDNKELEQMRDLIVSISTKNNSRNNF